MSAFLDHVRGWKASLPSKTVAELTQEVGSPQALVVCVVDMLRGFCRAGPLASERVGRLEDPVAGFLQAAHAAGVRSFYLICDSHRADAREFRAYPPHCVTGTAEAEVVPSIAGLPFADLFRRVEKNSLNGFLAGDWALNHRGRTTCFVVVGNCTDLCVYQLAMSLECAANQWQEPWRVVVPAALVDTYDVPVDNPAGAPPHDADLLHHLFLYHMALNGVEVVADLR
ncbi:MAG: isochorismatase family protein [Clostridia bacterium]|nr:isochorismatase family protein [Clostridia bacterium]